jgi:hypothetical protein
MIWVVWGTHRSARQSPSTTLAAPSSIAVAAKSPITGRVNIFWLSSEVPDMYANEGGLNQPGYVGRQCGGIEAMPTSAAVPKATKNIKDKRKV